MARYAIGGTATIAGTSVRPIFGLLNTASVSGIIRQVAIWNTTVTECEFQLVRFTGGTAGTDLTETRRRRAAPAAECVGKAGWTADATIDENVGDRIYLSAAKGSGAFLNFGAEGLETHDLGTTKGFGMIPVGTGQIVEYMVEWEE